MLLEGSPLPKPDTHKKEEKKQARQMAPPLKRGDRTTGVYSGRFCQGIITFNPKIEGGAPTAQQDEDENFRPVGTR